VADDAPGPHMPKLSGQHDIDLAVTINVANRRALKQALAFSYGPAAPARCIMGLFGRTACDD
jgi:hypothetical protein